MTNTLAYNENPQLTDKEIFITLSTELRQSNVVLKIEAYGII